jgi:hypothetical protein
MMKPKPVMPMPMPNKVGNKPMPMSLPKKKFGTDARKQALKKAAGKY